MLWLGVSELKLDMKLVSDPAHTLQKCLKAGHLGVAKVADLEERSRAAVKKSIFKLDISAGHTLQTRKVLS